MEFWQAVSFCEPEQLLEVAKICDDVGFAGILVSDHLFQPEEFAPAYPYSPDGDPGFSDETPWPDAWSAISAMAAVTTRLRFSTMVYILPLRNPLAVARVTGTVAVLSGNRVALGAGAGWMREEFDVLGVDFSTRGRRFDESIEVLRKLWSGQTVEHRGDHFEFPPLRMLPAPSQPVPIWIGGISRAALRRAARLGDGWLGSGQTPEDALALLAELARLRVEAGRASVPFHAITPLVTPPDADSLRRLEDAGSSGTVSYPFSYTLGPASTLAQKRQYLETFANDVISKLG